MASIYTDSEGNQRSYMDFYMFMDEDSRLPEYEELDVLPNKDLDDFSGLIIPADQEIVFQSLSIGMPFITTDKALQYLYEYYLAKQEETKEE